MNAEEGRHQTTKGAFMSVTTSEPGHLDVPLNPAEGDSTVPRPGRPALPLKDPLLVVDFEGTDGAERGEDQSLERHLSLFALSIADTLIVNMWTTEVGRFNGANLSLLRTVFEVNLQLFSHDHNLDKERPTLLFVMRDSTNPTHFTKNCERVRASIDKIWETIHKPSLPGGDALSPRSDSIERFFNIQFFAFPHYELQRADFIEHVNQFRAKFTNKGEEGGIFTGPDSFRGIPLEAVPQYLTSCWESILKSKDLDIPSQREMLSRFRCKDIVDERIRTYKAFTSQICERLTDRADITLGGRVLTEGKAGGHTLQDLLQTEFDRLVAEYNDESKLYSQRVVIDHRDRLKAELFELYNSTVKVQCNVIIKEVMRNLEGDVHELVDGIIRTHIWQNANILRTAELPLGGPVESPTSPTVSDISHEEVCSVVKAFWKGLCEGTRTMATSVSTSQDSVQRQLLGRCYGVVQADHSLQQMISGQLNVAVATLIKKRLETMASDVAGAMHKTFEYVLNHHPDGSIKLFSTPEGLQKHYRPARFAGLVLAACLFYCRMEVMEHASTAAALLHGDDEDSEDGLLDDEGNAANQALFARTLSSMTNVTVKFAENDAEKLFYLELGKAQVAIEMAATAGNVPTGASVSKRGGGGSGSDSVGVSVGFGVFYPPLPDSQCNVFTPRAMVSEKSLRQEDEDDEDEEAEVSTTISPSDQTGIILHNVLISRSALRRALQLFHQQMYFTFQVQLANVEAKSRGAHIPVWMWVALLYFAHDELFYVLRSPVLLILAILAAYFFCSAFIEGKWKEFEETGPPVVVAFIRQGIHMAKPYADTLRDQFKPLNQIGADAPQTEKEERTGPSAGEMAAATLAPPHTSTTADDGLRRRRPTGQKEE
eukprot:GILI01006392.1.p1 GENE.GILI01006392.1~~GILI01006392.1.p1  ORF type:complete len:991 (-),score=209.82 GILI01006392.1:130-2778(-)